MGRQINFYMAELDEQAFLQHLHADPAVVIIPSISRQQEVLPLSVLPAKSSPGWFMVWLWNGGISPSPHMHYIPQQHYYTVDRQASEVIEFQRSSLEEDCLVRGRLWMEPVLSAAESSGGHGRKRNAFLLWYLGLVKWIKRNAIRDEVGDYLLPGASAFAAQGGRLCQMLLAPNVRTVVHPMQPKGAGMHHDTSATTQTNRRSGKDCDATSHRN